MKSMEIDVNNCLICGSKTEKIEDYPDMKCINGCLRYLLNSIDSVYCITVFLSDENHKPQYYAGQRGFMYLEGAVKYWKENDRYLLCILEGNLHEKI